MDKDMQPRVESHGGVTIRYTKRGKWTVRSAREWDQARKQMGQWEAEGLTADSPVYSFNEPHGIDPTEMTIWIADFDDTVPDDDPDKKLAWLLYKRLEMFNEALATFIGRKERAKDKEALVALAEAVRETGHYMASLTAYDFLDDIEEEEETEGKTTH